jgi:hypothetical protein
MRMFHAGALSPLTERSLRQLCSRHTYPNPPAVTSHEKRNLDFFFSFFHGTRAAFEFLSIGEKVSPTESWPLTWRQAGSRIMSSSHESSFISFVCVLMNDSKSRWILPKIWGRFQPGIKLSRERHQDDRADLELWI